MKHFHLGCLLKNLQNQFICNSTPSIFLPKDKNTGINHTAYFFLEFYSQFPQIELCFPKHLILNIFIIFIINRKWQFLRLEHVVLSGNK